MQKRKLQLHNPLLNKLSKAFRLKLTKNTNDWINFRKWPGIKNTSGCLHNKTESTTVFMACLRAPFVRETLPSFPAKQKRTDVSWMECFFGEERKKTWLFLRSKTHQNLTSSTNLHTLLYISTVNNWMKVKLTGKSREMCGNLAKLDALERDFRGHSFFVSRNWQRDWRLLTVVRQLRVLATEWR